MKEWMIASCLLMAAVLIIRWCFARKISAKLRYTLWGFVLVRLLIPVSLFESDISVMNLAVQAQPVSAPSTWEAPQVYNNDFAPAVTAGDSSAFSNTYETYIEPLPEAPPASIPWANVAKWIWAAGAAVSGLWFAGVNIRFYCRLRKTRVRLELDEESPVYIAQGIASPCLFGVPFPAIYITPQAAAHPYLAEHILAHEQCHKQHGDHIWSVLRGVCLALWWWNPLVWVCAYLSSKDAEAACDEAVIGKIGEKNRLAYGYTLVDMVGAKQGAAGLLCAATTMAAGKKEIAERMKRIVKKQKTALWAAGAAILILAIVAGCTFTGAKEDALTAELPDWPELQENGQMAYSFYTVEYGEITGGLSSLYEPDGETMRQIIEKFSVETNLVPGKPIYDMPHAYRLAIHYLNDDMAAYYVYLDDGQPMIQLGAEGLAAAPLDADLYSLVISKSGQSSGGSALDGYVQEALKEYGEKLFADKQGFHASAHNILKVETEGEFRRVYAATSYHIFESDGERLRIIDGFNFPAIVTMKKEGYRYAVVNYATRSATSNNFSFMGWPSELTQITNDFKIYTSLLQAQYARAYAQNNAQSDKYSRINPLLVVEKSLEAVMSSPAQSSNPGDYIAEHRAEYEDLLDHGQYTLRYIFGEFLNGGQNGLKGHIMVQLMQDLMDDSQIGVGASPQDTFDMWHQYVLAKRDRVETYEMDAGETLLLTVLRERETQA